jgi:hypothetical protein
MTKRLNGWQRLPDFGCAVTRPPTRTMKLGMPSSDGRSGAAYAKLRFAMIDRESMRRRSSRKDLRLIDRVAILNAGHEAEVVFGHFLLDWASSADRTNTLNLLAANEIREIPEIEGWIAEGSAHARKVLRKHEPEIHALAARLMECRRMAGDEFKRFVDTIKG